MTSEWWEPYRDLCRQSVTVRRYTGTDPSTRTKIDYVVRGNIGQYNAQDLVGAIRQGDYMIIVLAEDLMAQNFPLPIVGSDRVLAEEKELSVLMPKRREDFDGELVAYELHCRG